MALPPAFPNGARLAAQPRDLRWLRFRVKITLSTHAPRSLAHRSKVSCGVSTSLRRQARRCRKKPETRVDISAPLLTASSWFRAASGDNHTYCGRRRILLRTIKTAPPRIARATVAIPGSISGASGPSCANPSEAMPTSKSPIHTSRKATFFMRTLLTPWKCGAVGKTLI